MFDLDLIETMNESEQLAVKQSIMTLCHTGLVDSQRERIIAQLSNGYAEEDDDKLMESVRRFRRAIAGLDQLREIGHQFMEEEKERNNAQ